MSDEQTCPLTAMYRYTWPGKDEAVICPAHAPQLQGIAAAIGLHLQLIPIAIEDVDTNVTCQQKLSAKEVAMMAAVDGNEQEP